MRRALSFILIRRGNIALRRKAHFRRILRFPVPIGSVTGTFLSSPQLLHSSLSHSYSLSPVSTLSTSAFSFSNPMLFSFSSHLFLSQSSSPVHLKAALHSSYCSALLPCCLGSPLPRPLSLSLSVCLRFRTVTILKNGNGSFDS